MEALSIRNTDLIMYTCGDTLKISVRVTEQCCLNLMKISIYSAWSGYVNRRTDGQIDFPSGH